MKTCARCGETKPLDGGFHRDKSKRDGRVTMCKSCVKAYQSEWRERPDVKAHKAEYYSQNRDAILAQQAEYCQRNPHRGWVGVYQQRAKKYGYPVVIEPFTKDELIARWGDACWHCGGPFEELDHYPIPVAKGGHHVIENCRPSCTPCNAKGCVIRRTNTTTEKSN